MGVPVVGMRTLTLSIIRTDGGTQPRAQLDLTYIADLAQTLQDGNTLPPVTVFFDETEYWLADGFHRYHATQEVGRESIDADIRQGTRRDAVLYSVGANASHGLRRTNADKRRSVETLLNDPEWVKWPDNQIAKQCGVNQSTVSRIRQENPSYALHKMENPFRIVERNGSTYAMNTSNIGSAPTEDTTEVIPASQFVEEMTRKVERQLQERADLTSSYPLPLGMYGGIPPQFIHRDIAHLPLVSFQPDVSLPVEEDEVSLEAMEQVEAAGRVLQQAVDWKRSELEQRIARIEDEVKERRDAHVMQVMGSSESPEWFTPREIVQRVCELMGTIDLDPCSNSHEIPNVPASMIYTKEDDGLAQKWVGKTYLNPPYGAEISKWVNKLIDEYEHGEVEEAIALLPGRIDTVWFSPLYEYVMCHVRGRIQFENSPHHAPFPCVIVYLGKRLDDFIGTFKEIGPIMRRIG